MAPCQVTRRKNSSWCQRLVNCILRLSAAVLHKAADKPLGDFALKPSCFSVSGHAVICKRAARKTGKNVNKGRAEEEHDVLPICK